MSAPKEILDLVERFERNKDADRSPQYNETQLLTADEIKIVEGAT